MKMVTSTLTTMPPTDGMAIGFITSEPRPVAQKMGIKFISCCGRLARARGRYPQQQPDLPSGLAPAGVDKNFCRQWSLQK